MFLFGFGFYPRFYIMIVICIRPSAWTKHGLRRPVSLRIIYPRQYHSYRKKERKWKKKEFCDALVKYETVHCREPRKHKINDHKHSGVELLSNPIPTKINWKNERARVNSWEAQHKPYPGPSYKKQTELLMYTHTHTHTHKTVHEDVIDFFFTPMKPFAMVLLQ